MAKILLKTFEKEVDEQKLISIKEECKKIFVNSDIEYKLDMESDVVGGSRRQSGRIEYYVYLCVEDEKEEDARRLIDEWFADEDELIVDSEIEEGAILDEELMVDGEENEDTNMTEKDESGWFSVLLFSMLIVGISILILAIIRKNFVMTAVFLLWIIYVILLIRRKD